MENQNQDNSKMGELNVLVDMIVDYYCFKNNVFDDDQEDNENWKKGTKYEENNQQDIIPPAIDKLIEASFTHQLKKFTKD